jgi:phosphopantothenoylcysteine decarboxylase/phosphopantothenate--cysteine ligase
MKRKKFDSVVLNIQSEPGVGFGYDTNKIQIINIEGNISNFDMKAKTEVAKDIVTHLTELISK